MKFLIAILLIIPILVLAKDKPNPQYIVKVGDMAPDFTLTYPDGKTCKLSDLRGKIVMLQFTASWCEVCQKEMPHIEKEIWAMHRNDNNFVLVGIDFKEDTSKITKFIHSIPVSYPLLLDPEGAIFNLYAEKDAGVTRNVIIDKTGRIVFLTRLYDIDEFNAMKAKINELLAEKM